MGFLNKYPYTDFHELNLDYILNILKTVEKTLTDFVSLNAIKYADPIQWDITRQYEKNTVVIDPLTGTAYISVAPVPIGAALTRTEYWTVVFDLESFVTKASENFANTYEAQTTITATQATPQYGWLVWGGILYVANTNITPGDAYVVDGNITRIRVEDIVGHIQNLNTTDKSSLVAAINEVLTTLISTAGDLSDLDTTDQSNLVAAINEVITTFNGAVLGIRTDMGDLDNLTTTDKTSLVNAINEVLSDLASAVSTIDGVTGDLANLTTTDKTSLVNAINEVLSDLASAVSTIDGVTGDLANLTTTDKTSLVNAINEVLSDLASAVSTIDGVTGDLANLTTTDKTSLVNAINEVLSDLTSAVSTIDGVTGDLANLTTTDKTSLVNAINEVYSIVTTSAKIVTPEQFGAVGDGVTDDTAAIQAAINSGASIVVINGTYLVSTSDTSPYHTIEVPSNISIVGHGTITLDANSHANYDIFHITNKSHVLIDGLTIIGDLDNHQGVTGEWGFGINVNDSTDITLSNLDVSKCWGDGVYIGHFSGDGVLVTMTARVKLDHSHVHHNRRNNVTMICGDACIVSDCELDHASGTSPQAGIDLEPDDPTEILSNFVLANCYIHDNDGAAVDINKTSPANIYNILIHNNVIYGSRVIGGFEAGGTHSDTIIITNNELVGNVIISGTNLSYNLIDNIISIIDGVATVPIQVNNISTKIIGNRIMGKTAATYIIELTDTTYTSIKDNIFECNAGYGWKIHVSTTASNVLICDNSVELDSMTGSGFVALASTNKITISNNRVADVNKPAYFVTLDTGVLSDSEIVTFNTVNVSNGLSNDTVNAASNVVNGTLV